MTVDLAADPEVVQFSATVAEYRRRIEAEPDSLHPAYADALMGLAARLAELELPEEALAAALEGVTHLQSLAAADPVVFAVHLASGLNNLSNRLGEAGREDDARRAGGQAVSMARAALGDRSEQARFVLLSALMNQAGRAWRMGDSRSALADMGDAVVAFREGGDATAPYLGPVVESLHRNAMALGEVGLWNEAIAVRRLAGQCFPEPVPAPVDHLLALTLEQAAAAAGRGGRAAEALPLMDEAVALARRLAAADVDTYRLFLAQALAGLAGRRHEAGADAAGMDAAIEAISLFQVVAQTDAGSAVMPLALTLETFATILRSLGHAEQADTVLEQRDTLLAAMEAAHAEEEGGCSSSSCSCH